MSAEKKLRSWSRLYSLRQELLITTSTAPYSRRTSSISGRKQNSWTLRQGSGWVTPSKSRKRHRVLTQSCSTMQIGSELAVLVMLFFRCGLVPRSNSFIEASNGVLSVLIYASVLAALNSINSSSACQVLRQTSVY